MGEQRGLERTELKTQEGLRVEKSQRPRSRSRQESRGCVRRSLSPSLPFLLPSLLAPRLEAPVSQRDRGRQR